MPDPFPILMADDDAMDRILIQEAFQLGAVANPLHFVEDGEQLMRYLRRQAPYEDSARYPMPGIILLDLNMPRLDGRTCLLAIRQDSQLKHLPVVVMTTSAREEEVLRSYTLGANAFMHKPVDFDQLVTQIKGFAAYWCLLVELPDAE